MEVFLSEYGLSTDEGVALMCLAEALLRVPDALTIDELIEDKIAPSSWGEHLGQSSSSLVNASTWALMLTGKVLSDPKKEGLSKTLHSVVRRLGEPVVRTAVKRAMKEMGQQFVLGQDIHEAIKRGRSNEKDGFTYSYDMLGEAALTAEDAKTFFESYSNAITALGEHAKQLDTRENPGISIKLSALHPRYEVAQRDRVMAELVPLVQNLAKQAKDADLGLNIDAEEADRLELSLEVIEAVISDPIFEGWDGFGIVVQAYGKRASVVIDWIHELAQCLDRKFMVRLVKGAYWDTEIKVAQVEGMTDFPVFTDKAATDVSYICCAKKLLDYSDRIYPQFATHNAHTVSAIINLAGHNQAYEFQRLHGMGETLHSLVLKRENTRCRIYAPVGPHKDLLAYLVRRLLENGANSSFVNQIVDKSVSANVIAEDPFLILHSKDEIGNTGIRKPSNLYLPNRKNSSGWDLRNYDDLDLFNQARDRFKSHTWTAAPIIKGAVVDTRTLDVVNPSDPSDIVGRYQIASVEDAERAITNSLPWTDVTAEERARILNVAADFYEKNSGEIFAVLCREAGKTAMDAIAEIREAVDFLRYYANEAVRLGQFPARGTCVCISPWNFPLAIFTGQIAAALAAGNAVIAKPAEPTPLIAGLAIKLLHRAGIPVPSLQFVPGPGSTVGAKLTTDPRINGICFTGSTGVAQTINRTSAKSLEPDSTFIAETGGLNAMIVDSTALPEQAVKDIVDSAFRSCGQRCSALRMLYLQKDIADDFLKMLFGAMDELEVSNPWSLSSDVGPVITRAARDEITAHIEIAQNNGKLLKQLEAPQRGLFLGPAVISVDGIADLEREIFGPVLHVATFEADEIDAVVDEINVSGFGLTFGLHTRIDDRVEQILGKIAVGNIYVNRNQIGAVVESQPFGGEGLSGTGPKAGGPHYVRRFKRASLPLHNMETGPVVDPIVVQRILDGVVTNRHAPFETRDMPGPTGESNRWSTYPRGTILCLGPTAEDARSQMELARSCGCGTVAVAPGLVGENLVSGVLDRAHLQSLQGFAAVALWSDLEDARKARSALALRDGPLIPIFVTDEMHELCLLERHLCIDTTASGGNAALLASQ